MQAREANIEEKVKKTREAETKEKRKLEHLEDLLRGGGQGDEGDKEGDEDFVRKRRKLNELVHDTPGLDVVFDATVSSLHTREIAKMKQMTEDAIMEVRRIQDILYEKRLESFKDFFRVAADEFDRKMKEKG